MALRVNQQWCIATHARALPPSHYCILLPWQIRYGLGAIASSSMVLHMQTDMVVLPFVCDIIQLDMYY